MGAVDALRRRFAEARRGAGGAEHDHVIAGARVRVRYAGRGMEAASEASLAHVRVPVEGAAALTVCVWDDASTGMDYEPPPWDTRELGAHGVIGGATEQGLYATLQPANGLLAAIDVAVGEAFVHAPDARALFRWDRAAPYRTIFAAFFEARGQTVTHAAAVGVGGRGVLLGGRGGSGKSSTSLACLQAGLQFVGDDYVLCDSGGDGGPATVHSLYATAKAFPHDVARLPVLARVFERDARPVSRHVQEQKEIAFLHPALRERLAERLELVALLLPRVTGEVDTRVVPMSAAHALRALAPSTVFQHGGPAGPALAALGRLARKVRCASLELGTDRGQIPAVIAAVIRETEGT